MLGFDRITFDPNVMTRQACIRDTRVPVSPQINLVTSGMDRAETIESYPHLEDEDIRQALQYAAWLAEEKVDAAATGGVDSGRSHIDPSAGSDAFPRNG